MLFTYDGQIRRYLTQTIRFFSNFCVRYGDGTLAQIPVLYGDSDRQVANILHQNTENVVNAAPRISVYIAGLSLDRERTADPTYVGKMHFRERDIDTSTGAYTTNQGRTYTVERMMPTPFKLEMKVDFWSVNTEQRLQMIEQVLYFFNPSVELQSNDNYIDWGSLTVLTLTNFVWDSRTVPTGTSTNIDISTLTLEAPIWLSPPVKVKHLGVITNIIASLWNNVDVSPTGYIDGLGVDLTGPTQSFSELLSNDNITISNFGIQVYNSQAIILGPSENVSPSEPTLDISLRQGTPVNWSELFNQYPGKYVAGVSRLYLTQPNGTEVIGTIAVNPMDDTILTISWFKDTLTSNTDILSQHRPNSPGTFDAIINPLTYNPKRPNNEFTDQPIIVGLRFLIIEDIGNAINQDGADAWKSTSGIDLIAKANDIIEWDGSQWVIIFDSATSNDMMIWQTNTYTGIQYLWNGIQWIKSFEGEYRAGKWRIIL
jgi:T4-like virus Myoviridae tail sheath stabiliser